MIIPAIVPNALSTLQVIVIALIFIVFFIIIYKIRTQFKNVNYFREIPDNLHPAILQYYNDGGFDNRSIWLIILNLIRSGYYKFERIEINEVIDYKLKWQKDDFYELDSFKLKDYEKTLVKYINTFIISNKSKDKTILLSTLNEQMKADFNLPIIVNQVYESLRSEVKYSYGFYHTETNYLLVCLLSLSYYFTIFPVENYLLGGVIYTGLILIITRILSNTSFSIKGLFSVILLIYFIAILISPILLTFVEVDNPLNLVLIYFNPILIILATYILKIEIYTPKQKELMKKIHGLKTFLKDFTILKYRPVDYINFVNYYYVLAEAFNIKITDQEYTEMTYDDETFETLTTMEFGEIAFSNLSELLILSQVGSSMLIANRMNKLKKTY